MTSPAHLRSTLEPALNSGRGRKTNMATVSKVSAAAKPLLSQSSGEARRRVLNLYRAWYREVNRNAFYFGFVLHFTWKLSSNEMLYFSNQILLKMIIIFKVPRAVNAYALDITTRQGREKVKEEFLKHADVKDIKTIDMLVIKVLYTFEYENITIVQIFKPYRVLFFFQGRMELEETHKIWKQRTHVMRYFKETYLERKTDFLSRFYDGYD